MNKHWTASSIEDFRFRITADFIAQLEDKMESIPLSPKELAEKLGITKGRVSQIFNNPGNISLKKIIEYSKALEMKVALVAYEDNDPENKKGPINSEIFRICWEKCDKPNDFWAFREVDALDASLRISFDLAEDVIDSYRAKEAVVAQEVVQLPRSPSLDAVDKVVNIKDRLPPKSDVKDSIIERTEFVEETQAPQYAAQS